ncbi:MAG TPA: sulfatase-like hydrolase/transferase [Thermoanaerobaculia bacterium]|nr:sulfatase-like hydrolase/transferase [Thermoanaerobaculia bacterium]
MSVRSLVSRTAIIIGAALLAACHGSRGAVDGRAPIIIISIDTLRSDHLPAYGYTKVETPAIDRFRGDAILFEHAYSHCPLTLVSHASVFTGLLPADHGIRDNLGYDLNPKAKTLAELLKSKGYATGGAVSAVVLRGETGIRRGFDFWEDNIDIDPTYLSIGRAQRSGEVTRALAEKWIGQHDRDAQPFFFFFHIYEPHTPYEPVEPFRSRYPSAYDGEIATADQIVGKFLDYLRAEGIYDRATILLMSDHGEGLGDHGEDEHGVLLYRETLQVPLMLKLPKEARKGTSVSAPVQLIDVFPTIASAFGVPQTLAGRSLLDIADAGSTEDRPIYSETYYPRLHFGWNDLHSLISGAKHYIHASDPELYDLAADPAETKNVLLDDRRTYVALRERIRPYIKGPASPSAVDDEQKQQLIALGYVGSTVTTAPDAVLPDPKKNIGKANAISQAFRLFRDQKYQETLAVTGGLLRDNPNMLDIWALQSRALAKLDRREEAIEAAKQGLRVSPNTASLAVTVANLSLELGRLDDAEAHAKLILKQTPHDAHEVLARVALRRKDFAKARAEANAAFDNEKNRPGNLMLLGQIALEEGKLDDALRYFDQAAAIRPTLPRLNFFRGDTLARMGRAEEAETALQAEIRISPTDPQPYKNLILLYAVEGRNDAATQLIFALEKASPTPPSYVAISETLKTIGDAKGSRFWASRGLSRFPADRQLQALYRG